MSGMAMARFIISTDSTRSDERGRGLPTSSRPFAPPGLNKGREELRRRRGLHRAVLPNLSIDLARWLFARHSDGNHARMARGADRAARISISPRKPARRR